MTSSAQKQHDAMPRGALRRCVMVLLKQEKFFGKERQSLLGLCVDSVRSAREWLGFLCTLHPSFLIRGGKINSFVILLMACA